MGLTTTQQAGFSLAALLADDGALTRVEGAIEPETAARLRAGLAREPQRDRAQQLAQLLARVRPPLAALPALPPRALALLAPQLPRHAAAARAACEGLAMRKGFASSPELLALLLRLARAARAREAPR